MTMADIRNYRLLNQQIGKTAFTKPGEIVSWMGAMQAQEFAMAKWAIGLRLPGSTEKDIEDAFNKGDILRTHLLRPTWHFVAPADIRWLLMLTAPRVHALNDYYYRKAELDSKTLTRSNDILSKSLQGGKYLTRVELQSALGKAKIKADGQRLAYIMMQAELDGIICSGPRRGNQFTYALLEERVPIMKKIDRKEALGKLMNRFFTSRGPASLNDFAYWSSLTLKEIREGTEMLDKNFTREKINGHEYFFLPLSLPKDKNIQRSFLMPDYDEYGMSYKDRSAIINKKVLRLEEISNTGYSHAILINGIIDGKWMISKEKKEVIIQTYHTGKINKRKEKAIKNAIARYSSFHKFLTTVHIINITA